MIRFSGPPLMRGKIIISNIDVIELGTTIESYVYYGQSHGQNSHVYYICLVNVQAMSRRRLSEAAQVDQRHKTPKA